MSKDNTSLLGELVASSDNPQTLRAQLVEATVVRPDALQEIQRTVMLARGNGTVDEAAATRILFQVDLLVEMTKVLGVEPTRLREIPPQRLNDIAATQMRPSPAAIDATRQRTTPEVVDATRQRPAPDAIDATRQRPAVTPAPALVRRPEYPPTEAIPAQAAAVAAARAAMPAAPNAAVPAPAAATSSGATTPAPLPQRTLATGKTDSGITLVAGTVLKDRFVLKREIGRGGMGAVFAAEDMRKVEANDPEPMVAVKVLSPDFARHPVAFVALQRESRRAQTLAHPNVATVYDFDRDGDLVFMTMELLSGSPLDQVIRETEGKGLERARALAILIDITRGLAYAHRKGLVHADLKPGNIFLVEGNVPKVLDFGIARAVPGHTVAKKDSFDAGALGAYTPAYATSEMIEGGDPHTADDVYALGIIAYELFTGKHPYQRLSGQAAEKRKLKPAPIKGLPRRQWNVIERSLSFDRKQRPVDASAFLKSLFGITPLQKGLIAVAVVLAGLAVFFAIARYQAAGPEIPFEDLKPEVQAQFREKMTQGNTFWNFYLKENQDDAWHIALQDFADAWDLHPRNREATKALREVADRVLADHAADAAIVAVEMRERSKRYLKDYPPVMKIPPPADSPPQ
jgi:predicted Ser/Thr protein kinase